MSTIASETRNQSQKTIEEIFLTFEKRNPEPKTELEYKNPFQLLVAVILSAQSSDKMVNRCTKDLFAFCTHPKHIINLGFDGFLPYVKQLGLYRNKSKNILKTSELLIEKHNGYVPDNFEDLVLLPGVGRKSADVVLNVVFEKPTIPIDRHIFRVVHRIGITNGKSVEEVGDSLLEVVPDKYKKNAHHWLLLHGRYICMAQKPRCEQCPISQHCLTFNKAD